MNTWNTLPESYQHRVYNNTLATVNRQMQQAKDPTPAVVISVEAARVDNAILLDYLPSEEALEEPEIGSTDPHIPIDSNCTDGELQFRMPEGSRDYKDQGDERDVCNDIPTTNWRRRAETELQRFDLGPSDVEGYECEDGDDADADEEDEASQSNDGSMKNVKD